MPTKALHQPIVHLADEQTVNESITTENCRDMKPSRREIQISSHGMLVDLAVHPVVGR
jgi:hypothetical protein